MKFDPWQIIVSTFLGVALVLGVTLFAIAKGWMPPSTLAAPLTGILVAAGSFVAHRFQMAVKEKDTELRVEKARSEIPPALKGATVYIARPRMPSVADLSEMPPDAPSTPETPTTDVKVEVIT